MLITILLNLLFAAMHVYIFYVTSEIIYDYITMSEMQWGAIIQVVVIIIYLFKLARYMDLNNYN